MKKKIAKKVVKKVIKKRVPRAKPDPLTSLLETLQEYYKDDALAPGISLAILPYIGKPTDKKLWYCSMSRYVKSTNPHRIKRLTFFKNTGSSLEEVIQKVANRWYNSVMGQMNVIKKSRIKETLK